jgi:hypothetical protein
MLALLLPAVGISALGSTAVATVTSALAFVIDGHSIDAPGVTSFPLVVGDTVATSQGSAVLFFPDGSAVKLGINSSAKIDGDAASPKLILLAGALDYRLVPGSNLAITNLEAERDKPVASQRQIMPKATDEDAKKMSDWTNPAFLVPHATGTGAGPLPSTSDHL